MLRKSAVAGTWYPSDPEDLAREVDAYLAAAPRLSAPSSRIRAIITPHAGLMYSGATAAAAWGAVRGGDYELIVLVGPSHYVSFDGVAVWPAGAFATPLGDVPVLDRDVQPLLESSCLVSVRTDAHTREHALEMQLPFIVRLFPGTPIVGLVMGEQTRTTVDELAHALVRTFRERRVLLAASSDLSHFFDAQTAATLDGRVAELVAAFDSEALMTELERYPAHERGRYVMCGGGPAVAVMRAARALATPEARVIARSHSGLVSGDHDCVVGYMAAAFGDFEQHAPSLRG